MPTLSPRPPIVEWSGGRRAARVARAGRRPGALSLAIAASVGLAVASLALPSAPGYDPWSWLVWGREVVALDLSTSEGPAWKPLPVLLTAPLTAVSDALAPPAWLGIARGGAILAVAVAFSLARRLSGGSSLGGVAAGAGILLVPGWIESAAVGNAEGLLTALLLLAVACVLDRRLRAAFALLLLAALLRAEVWPFFAVVGAVVARRDPGARVPVGLAAVAVPALWFVPELVGSGELLRSAERARVPNPGAPALATHPALATLGIAFRLPPPVALAGVGALLAVVLARPLIRRLWGSAAVAPVGPRARRPGGGAWPVAAAAGPRTRRLGGGLCAVAAAGAAWIVLVAAMSELGFSGEARYLLPGAALLTVAGMAALFSAPAPAAPGRNAWARIARFGLAASVAAALTLTGAARWDALRAGVVRVAHGAALASDLERAIDRAGGKRALLRCGPPRVGPYRGPLAAWALGVRKEEVGFEPARPGVALRSRLGASSPIAPTRPPDEPDVHVRTTRWEIVGFCRSGAAGRSAD